MKTTLLFILLFYCVICYAPPTTDTGISYLNHIVEISNKIELELYLDAIHKSESPKSWDTINYLGCIGGYQLSSVALKDIGYTGTIHQLRASKDIQHKLMIKLLKRNKYYLDFYGYSKYFGKTIHGVKITLSGALGACHLSGIGGFGKFIKSNYNATDGNGTTIKYLKKFENYNLDKII